MHDCIVLCLNFTSQNIFISQRIQSNHQAQAKAREVTVDKYTNGIDAENNTVSKENWGKIQKVHRAPKYFSLWSLCHFVQKASSPKQNQISPLMFGFFQHNWLDRNVCWWERNMKLSHFLILFQYSPIFRDISRYSFLSRFLATISSLTSTSVRKPVRTKPWFLHLDWHCHWTHWLLVNPTYGCALHPPPTSYYSSPAQCSSSSTPPPPPFLLDLH